MTEIADLAQSPRDVALGMLAPETRDTILRLDAERGMSLLNVMAAQYAARNGVGTEEDYLASVADREGVVMPADTVYDRALEQFDQLVGRNLPSQLRGSLGTGNPSLPAGTLMHSLRYGSDTLVTIALSGVVARDFSPDVDGPIMNDDMVCHAYFFSAPQPTTVGDFVQKLSDYSMAKKSFTRYRKWRRFCSNNLRSGY